MCPSHNNHIFVSWLSVSWLSLLFLIRTCSRARNAEKLWPGMLILWSLTSSSNNFKGMLFSPLVCPFTFVIAVTDHITIQQRTFMVLLGCVWLPACWTSVLLRLVWMSVRVGFPGPRLRCRLWWVPAAQATAWCWTPSWLNLQDISVSCTFFSELHLPGFAGNCTNQQRHKEMEKILT